MSDTSNEGKKPEADQVAATTQDAGAASEAAQHDPLVFCVQGAYNEALQGLSLIVAGLSAAVDEVVRRAQAGPLTEEDCEENRLVEILKARHAWLLQSVGTIAAALAPKVLDRLTGWPTIVAALHDPVKAYGEALCDCQDPIWAEAELRAALRHVKERTQDEWTAYDVANTRLLAEVRERVHCELPSIDLCPPVEGGDVLVIALLAGKPLAIARALQRHFDLATGGLALTFETMNESDPSPYDLQKLVRAYAELDADATYWRPIIRDSLSGWPMQPASAAGPAHPLTAGR